MYLNNDHTTISAYFKFFIFFYIEVPAVHDPISSIINITLTDDWINNISRAAFLFKRLRVVVLFSVVVV